MAYILPQVLVFQEFENQPVALDIPLLACIVGENFDLHRYSDPDEKQTIKVDSHYDPLAQECYAWPGRQAGAVVDETYTKVFIDNALLKYFNDAIGADSTITHVEPGKNRIRADNTIWQTANGSTRDASLLRDVKIGDVIKIVGNDCGSPTTFWSTIIGLIADVLPSSIDAAEYDVSNQTPTVLATSGSQTAGLVNLIELGAINGASYNGLDEGDPTEVYTVEVTGGGGTNAAILKITSQSGNDDQGLVTFNVAFGAAFPIGTRGLTAVFNIGTSSVGSLYGDPSTTSDDEVFIVGQKFQFTVSQAFTPPTAASSGTYAGTADTTYVVEVTRGGKFADTVKPQITATTTTGVDLSGPTTVSASATPYPAGTQGLFIAFTGAGLCKGDRYLVTVTAAAAGPVKTLVMANNLPDGLRGDCLVGSSLSSGANPDLDVTLYIKKDIEVPYVASPSVYNWTQSETEICINPAIEAYDADWNLSGVLQPLPVEDGEIYVQHRDRLSKYCSVVGTISDVTTVEDVLGKITPDNPLAFGVYNALLNSNGEEVKFVGVCSSSPVTLEDWLEALELLVGREDVYSLVPMTQDLQVQQAFVAHCDGESSAENGRWRICWLNRAAEEIIAIYTTSVVGTDQPILATITDDTDTSGLQYTIVEATGETFLAKNVRAGDTVRALYTTDGGGNTVYSEFTVDEVQNEETIRLVSGPGAPVNVPSKIEIWRTLTKEELATNLAQYPGLFSSRRAYLIWPDVVGNAGVTFPGYFLCAALAGLRSGVLPHQGLTNVELLGFDDVSRTIEFLTATQQNQMANSGYWIVTQDLSNGAIHTRHQLSTGNQAQLTQKEQNITTNLDHISFTFLNRLKQFIGRGNVTPTMIDIIQGEVISVLEEFKNTIVNSTLGPQILNADILELRQHPTFKDRVVVRIDLELPFPLNNIEMHLIV